MGRVLDYGCGMQPYREIVERHGEYHAFDRLSHPGSVAERNHHSGDPLREKWDTILCTQVLNYIPDPPELLRQFRARADALVLTATTVWAEVEETDLFRWTITGIDRVVRDAGWRHVTVVHRAQIPIPKWNLSLGFGVLAR